MRNKAHDLASYTFSSAETLLLDANVWLYLFPAPSDKSLQFARKYTEAFKQILAAKAPLVLDVLVLSEYANRYCRIEWEARYKATYPSFKKFRQSSDFASIGQAAAFFVREILAFTVAPLFAGPLVQIFGKSLGEPVGQGFDHNRAIVVMVLLEFPTEFFGAKASADGERAKVVL